jgi:DNA-damage-inducible protein J
MTKEEATAVLESLGLTLSDVIRELLVRIAQDKRLPFEMALPKGKERDRRGRRSSLLHAAATVSAPLTEF